MRKTLIIIGTLLVAILLVFGACAPAPASAPAPAPTPAPEREKIVMPNYSVLDEDVYDAPVKTQVALNILVSGEISEPGLEALLNQLYSSIATRGGFKYHDSPTNIYIYMFTSKERAESGMGQWIAMLQKSYADVEPTISINERQIAQLGAKPEQKFGLSEAERQQIWNEIVKSEDRARREAEQEFPDLDPLDPNYSQSLFVEQLEKQIELQRILDEKYKNELAEKYGLTRDQLVEIAGEGLTKDWPFPPPPSETLAPPPAPPPTPEPTPIPEPTPATTPETKTDREAMIEIFKANALENWGSDYQMVNYELENQTEAYDWVVKQTQYPEIMEWAKSEWQNDYEMVKYTYENQVEAYEWIMLQTAYPDIMERAKQDWGEDYEMVKYEYENQVEAYKALQ